MILQYRVYKHSDGPLDNTQAAPPWEQGRR